MKSFKMKALALATLGLGGLVMAGSAFGQSCPTDPAAPAGPWSAKSIGGGTSTLSIVTGGYDSTSCKMSSSLGNNGAAHAQVRDDSPANEARYRVQFIFDPTNLTGNGGTNQAVVLLVNSAATYDNTLNQVKIVFAGSGGGSLSAGKRIFIIAACDNAASQFKCQVPVTLPVQQGPNRIELDLVTGASGTGGLRYWVNDAATTGLADNAPTGTIAITGGNAGWVGVDTTFMGMTSPSSAYRGVNTDAAAFFDQFDSRRQTFIGH